MKKLTAGIFTVMLGLVAVDANAAITSKAYVDEGLATKVSTSTYDTKMGQIDAALGQKATSSDLTALTTRVGTAEGKITTLEDTVGDANNGLVKQVNANAGAITTLNAGADTENSVAWKIAQATKDMATTETITTLGGRVDTLENTVGDATDGLVKDVADNATAISAINNEATGILKRSKDYTDTEIGKINTSLEDYATTEALTTGLAGKQATLTEAQLNAVNSGITTAKVNAYDGYATTIASNTTLAQQGVDNAAAAKTAADNAQATANAAIPKVATNNSNGKYVLTATALNGNITYAWEDIERGTNAGTAE